MLHHSFSSLVSPFSLVNYKFKYLDCVVFICMKHDLHAFSKCKQGESAKNLLFLLKLSA